MALMGSLFLFLPFLFRRFLTTKALLFLTAYIAIAPSIVYWSRFSRHDYFMISAHFLLLYGLLIAPAKRRGVYALTSLALQLAIKENSYVFMALCLGYLIFEFFYLHLSDKSRELVPLLSSWFKNIKNYPWFWIGGLLLGSFIFCYFFSAGFKYPQGILDGLYRKSIGYWIKQHNIERIKGPFSFQFMILSMYEVVFIGALLISTIHFYFSRGMTHIISFFTILFPCTVLYFVFNESDLSKVPILQFFKLKIPFDIPLLFIFLIHPIVITATHLSDKKRGLAFFGYFTWANFFTYSYLGEKVPWLSLYTLVPGLIYLALYFGQYDLIKRKKFNILELATMLSVSIFFFATVFSIEERTFSMLTIIVCTATSSIFFFSIKDKFETPSFHTQNFIFTFLFLFTLRLSVMTNFGRAGKRSQIIGQVHTTWQFDKMARDLRRKYFSPISAKKPSIYLQGDALWPLTWYLRDVHTYRFIKDKDISKYDYVFMNVNDKSKNLLKKTHKHMIIPLRAWWVPNYKKMTLRNFLVYSFFQVPWSKTGHFGISFFKKVR